MSTFESSIFVLTVFGLSFAWALPVFIAHRRRHPRAFILTVATIVLGLVAVSGKPMTGWAALAWLPLLVWSLRQKPPSDRPAT